jgi:hypothetical protein
MATMTVNGIDEFRLAISDISSLPDGVLDDMINAQANIVKPAIVASARTVLKESYINSKSGKPGGGGKYSKGVVAGSVTQTKPKRTSDGKRAYLTFNGMRGKSRVAEIAFINEYGANRRGIPARPFMRSAIAASEDKAVEAGAKVLDDFLTGKGL